MSYGSGDNYSYDSSNTGGYAGYDDNNAQYGFNNNNNNNFDQGGYDHVGDSNPFGGGGGGGGGGDIAGGNPFDNFGNFDGGEDIAGGFSNAPVGGGGGFEEQYEVFGGSSNPQFDQSYSLTSEGGGVSDQYSVATSHASPDVLAETMQLPVPSGNQSPDVLGFPTQTYDTSSYGEGSNKKKKKKKKKRKGKASWYELAYYKALFDFDTDEIVRRLFSALNPIIYSKFWEENKSRPDLYVPVWGTTTLWFLLVACGTVASDLIKDNCSSSVEFDKVGWGAFATYGYIFFPALLWWVLFKFWIEIPMGLFDNVCIYGYSLLPYLPTMFIGIMPYTWIRWIPFGISCALSSYFLVINYFTELKDHMKQGAIIMGFQVLLNVGLCMLYKMYFFGTC